jgi:hypothetical protein
MNKSAAKSKQLGVVQRLLLAIAGIDPDRMATCSRGDRLLATKAGAQLFAALAFTGVTTYLVLAIGFAREPQTAAVAAFVAILVATIILLVDSTMVQADWYWQGRDMIDSRTLEGASFWRWTRWRRPVSVAARIMASAVLAYCFAAFIELRLFEDDIAKQIDREHKTANAPLFAALRREIDDREAEILAAVGEAEARVRNLHGEVARRHASMADTADLDSEIALYMKAIQEMTTRRSRLNVEIADRYDDAIYEQAGIKAEKWHSGMEGRGRNFKAANELAKIREGQVAQLSAEIVAAETKLAALRDERERRRNAFEAARQAENARLAEAVAAAEARRHDLDRRLVVLRQERETVPEVAKARGGYVEKPYGFLAQVRSLAAIKQEAAVSAITAWAKFVILLIEILPVATKILFGMPTAYAVRTALDLEAAIERELAANRRRRLFADKNLLRLEKGVEDQRVKLYERRGDALRKDNIQRRFYEAPAGSAD